MLRLTTLHPSIGRSGSKLATGSTRLSTTLPTSAHYPFLLALFYKVAPSRSVYPSFDSSFLSVATLLHVLRRYPVSVRRPWLRIVWVRARHSGLQGGFFLGLG